MRKDRVWIAVAACAVASPALAQDGAASGVGGDVAALLWLIGYVALATVVHLGAMALAGAGFRETVERVSIGIGPTLFAAKARGAGLELKLLPVAGSVKFAALGTVPRIIVPALALAALSLVAIVLGGWDFAVDHGIATLRALWAGVLSLSLGDAVAALMRIVQTDSLADGIAAVCAGMAAINALPLMIMNGGQVIWGIVGAAAKSDPNRWPIMEKVVVAEVVALFAVLAMFVISVAGWVFR